MIEFIKDAIYHLKMEYGSVAIFGTETVSINTETGTKTVTKSEFTIRKAICLPETFKQKFQLSLTSSGSGSNNKAGMIKYGEMQIIIDKTDLPPGRNILPDDYVVYKSKKYVVYGEPEDYEECVIIQLNSLKGVATP